VSDVQTVVVTPPAFQTTVSSAQVVTMIVRPGRGDPGATGYCLLHALNASEISEKKINLPAAPTGNVLLDVVGGTSQRQNVDFIVSGLELSWVGLSLELLLEEGNCLSISYF
jgi:hypothetical protein